MHEKPSKTSQIGRNRYNRSQPLLTVVEIELKPETTDWTVNYRLQPLLTDYTVITVGNRY